MRIVRARFEVPRDQADALVPACSLWATITSAPAGWDEAAVLPPGVRVLAVQALQDDAPDDAPPQVSRFLEYEPAGHGRTTVTLTVPVRAAPTIRTGGLAAAVRLRAGRLEPLR